MSVNQNSDNSENLNKKIKDKKDKKGRKIINKILENKSDEEFLFDNLMSLEIDLQKLSKITGNEIIRDNFFEAQEINQFDYKTNTNKNLNSKIKENTNFQTASGTKLHKPNSIYNNTSNTNTSNIYNKNERNDKNSYKNIPEVIRTPQLLSLLENNPSYQSILSSIVINTTSTDKTTSESIGGLSNVKQTLQEIIVWPLKNPEIFTGLRGPPKGLLLFGPPGTGKTLLGKYIASEVDAIFFSISCSTLLSKYIGEAEKTVKGLFEIANLFTSVIFIDEIDSILNSRSESEHEASRRLKTEFLVQMDGISKNKVLVIGATNRPQEIDEAARRRLVKRIYVPLPDKEAIKTIIMNLMNKVDNNLVDCDIETIALKLEGYSGSDVFNLCREASMGPVREYMMNKNNKNKVLRKISKEDFITAMKQIRKSVSGKDLEEYEKWNGMYGSL